VNDPSGGFGAVYVRFLDFAKPPLEMTVPVNVAGIAAFVPRKPSLPPT
jgi:hypothetical protein